MAAATPTEDQALLVRDYSPSFGPADAPVTLVEFFDPSCEACRAYHPVVQEIRRQFPTQVRVVLRYTVFHEGSDEAVRILEAARMQDKFEPVLDALLEQQPGWAVHGSPEMDVAWEIAGAAGLDLEKAETRPALPGDHWYPESGRGRCGSLGYPPDANLLPERQTAGEFQRRQPDRRCAVRGRE